MGRIVLAGVLSGLAVFAWGIVSWFLLPLHLNALSNFSQPQAEVDAFLDALPGSGVYHYPGLPVNADGSPPTSEQMNATLDRFAKGPRVALMVLHQDGSPPMPPSNFVFGIALQTLAGLLVATWMRVTQLPRFGQRFALGLSFGGFVLLSHYLPECIWNGYPAVFAVATIVDIAAGAVLVGLVTAAIMRPSVPEAPAEGV